MEYYKNEDFRLLVKALLSLEDETECVAFLEDLMTRKEVLDIAQSNIMASHHSRIL